MQIMALNIAEELAERHDVVVCTLSQYQRSCRFQISPVLTNCVFDDVSILKGIEVDVWFTLNASYAAIAPLLRAPVVAYFHGNDFLSPWRICLPRSLDIITRTRGLQRIRDTLRVALARHKIQQGLGHCVRILTNSSYSRTLILQTYQIEANRVLVCHPGVGSSYFQERESISARDYVHLMSVCRLDSSTRRKNIEGVLNALSLLEGAFPVRYTIVGDGDDRFRLEAIRDRLGLGHIVEFLGRASDDELRTLYRTADLFVLPVKASRRDVEGFGIVYLEANASGLPTLASATGGATDAIIDGRTGILIDNSEPSDIAAGLRRFVANRQDFDPTAIRAFANSFVWRIAAAKIEDVLVECCALRAA